MPKRVLMFDIFDIFDIKATTSPKYRPLIDYIWATKTTAAGVRYLLDFGTYPKYPAELLYNRGVKLGAGQSITIPVKATVQTIYYVKDGVQTFEEGTQVLTDYVIDSLGIHSNYIFYDGIFTTAQKDYLANYPEKFLYKESGVLKSQILSQAEIDNVVAYLPMCETDAYVRDLVDYSEGSEEVTNGDFTTDSDWAKGNGNWTISGGKATNDGTNDWTLSQTGVFDGSSTYLITFDVIYGTVGTIEARDDTVGLGLDQLSASGSYSVVASAPSGAIKFYPRTGFDGSIDNVSVKQLTGTYPIAEYTDAVRDNAINLTKGLQTCNWVRDALGVPTSGSFDRLECDGVGKAEITTHTATVDISVTTYPYELVGDVLSGNVSLPASGLIVDQDNEVVLSSQAVNGIITIGSGYKGNISIYREDIA